jgi:hypothetical protein
MDITMIVGVVKKTEFHAGRFSYLYFCNETELLLA